MKKEVINDLGKTSRSIVSAKGPKVEMILLLSLKKKKKKKFSDYTRVRRVEGKKS